MDIYQQSLDFFLSLPVVSVWQDMQDLYRRAAARRPVHWNLPLRACQAVGGSLERAVPAMTAVACAHISILLVDDMLDSDPRGAHHRLGMPIISDLACAFQSAALSALERAVDEPIARGEVAFRFNAMFLSTAWGQFLDVHLPLDEEEYWRVTHAKSSPFFGASLYLGALAGGASLQVAREAGRLGCVYGETVQVHDDLHDAMEIPANPDWLQGRRSLPILFAVTVRHPHQARFLELLSQIEVPGALQKAQEILLSCGAVSYCVDHILSRNQMAQDILAGLPLADREPLVTLLESVTAPVQTLLASCQD
ncbi:MAG: polyprenyl synthetase family protein [Chloroflexi bacterium]|nr:polyprenyl synthetase family protein [Chloroflexota bacterium]